MIPLPPGSPLALHLARAALAYAVRQPVPALPPPDPPAAFPSPPIATCVDEFMTLKRSELCRPKTLAHYQSTLRPFVRRHGSRHPATITPAEIFAYLHQWPSPTTRGTHWLALRECFRWLHGLRRLPLNPVPAAMGHPLPLGHRNLHYTPADARRLLTRALPTDAIGYWALALFSGLRTTEISRLALEPDPWSWFDFTHRLIHVPAHAAKVRARRSPMHPTLIPWLHFLHANARPFWPRRPALIAALRRQILLRRDPGLPVRYNRAGYSNLARRAFITYSLAEPHASYAETALRAGNSELIIRRYYRRPATPAQAAAYFNLTPSAL